MARVIATYSGIHMHLRRTRGDASTHACVKCGEPARDWSYQGGDPDEQTHPTTGAPYSLDPERYVPRCRPCHRTYDGPASKRLTDAQVTAIRARYVPGWRSGRGNHSGNAAALAAEFGITKQYVSQLARGLWRAR